MLTIDDLNQNEVMTVTARGKLTKADYVDMVSILEKILEDRNKLHFFIKLEECEGISAGALWEDIKFDLKHEDQFGKIAVIGDKRWKKWSTRFFATGPTNDVKFFSQPQKDEAWQWVNH